MPRGGFRPGAGRPKGSGAKNTEKGEQPKVLEPAIEGEAPLDYMLRVMNDPGADVSRRDRMAVAAASYLHPKASDEVKGKKEERQERAEKVGGRFSTPAAPKLVVDNRQ